MLFQKERISRWYGQQHEHIYPVGLVYAPAPMNYYAPPRLVLTIGVLRRHSGSGLLKSAAWQFATASEIVTLAGKSPRLPAGPPDEVAADSTYPAMRGRRPCIVFPVISASINVAAVPLPPS